VVVLDAALLLDWGLERDCDALIAVTAPPAEQLGRLVRQRGWTEEQARSRLAVQRSDEEFRAAADVTLDNSGSIEGLARAARTAVAALRAARPAERE
jgi:dephospho-CoA kinase